MVGYIECRSCDSPDCKGCNLKTLETMLKNGKFDCLMNENRAINASTDISPVVRGHFVHGAPMFAGGIDWWYCSECYTLVSEVETRFDYCPWCGARMDVRAE